MSRCKMVEIFYALVPVKQWRGFLIRRHVESCPRCLEGLASREEAGSLLVQERGLVIGPSVWERVETALRKDAGGEGIRGQAIQPAVMRRWGWATAAAFLIVLVTGFWLLKDFQPEGTAPTAAVLARFELEYVRVGGQPANPVIFQPQGSDMIIVWAGKNP